MHEGTFNATKQKRKTVLSLQKLIFSHNENTKLSHLIRTLRDAKNSMARATCNAQMYKSIVVNVTSACSVGAVHVAVNMSLRLRRNSSRLPCSQYSIIIHRSRSKPKENHSSLGEISRTEYIASIKFSPSS